MIRIGHRGAAGYAPENTIKSICCATKLGVDFVEIDVQASADGMLVLMHDKRVDRTTNGSGYVRNMQWDELRQLLDIEAAQPIPRLEEALEAVRGKTQLIIELIDPNIVDPVISLVKRVSSIDEVVLSSFHHKAMLAAHSIEPRFRTLALLEAVPVSATAFALEARCTHVGLAIDSITRDFVEDLHGDGLKVFSYTANDRLDIEFLYHMEIDGIYSDRPDLIGIE